MPTDTARGYECVVSYPRGYAWSVLYLTLGGRGEECGILPKVVGEKSVVSYPRW